MLLPNVEDSVEEIKYALDVLYADGFTLPTNTQGVYLGNPCLDPVMQEEFVELKTKYWGRHLWSTGYFCATVGGVTEEMIKEYIENQELVRNILSYMY